jgi:hypothetical protein
MNSIGQTAVASMPPENAGFFFRSSLYKIILSREEEVCGIEVIHPTIFQRLTYLRCTPRPWVSTDFSSSEEMTFCLT